MSHEATGGLVGGVSTDTQPSLSDTDMVERISNIFNPMIEMFAKYFKPQEITKSLQMLEKEDRQNILEESLLNQGGGMRLLLEEVLDADGELLLEFYKLITTFDAETDFLPGTLLSGDGLRMQENLSGLMHFIVQIVEQRKIEKLSSADMTKITDVMMKEKLIQKSRKSIDNQKPEESFKSLLELVKKTKADWPFHFWSILQNERPDIFFSSTSKEGDGSCSASSVGVDNQNSNELCMPRAEISSLKTKNWFQKLHVKPKDINSPALQMLIGSGALNPNKITTEEPELMTKIEAWNCMISSLSDGEDEGETERKVLDEDNSDLEVDLKLRDYQKELAVVALEGCNTIICAPTGSGKTRVALEIIIQHLKKDSGAKSHSKKVCFFARTVPLAVQQFKTIREYLPNRYNANIFTGDSEYSMTMHLQLDELDVVVLTPMILLNHIKKGNIKDLGVFSLLVFDECHHAREREPYNTLMSLYMDSKLSGKTELPQIVGLTASFPVEKANNRAEAVASILRLCANLDASTVSVVVKNKTELEKTVAVPSESYGFLQERNNDASYEKIISVMEKLEEEAQDCAQEIGEDSIKETLGKKPSDRKEQNYSNWAVNLLKEAEEFPRNDKETNIPVRLLMIIAKYLTIYHFSLETHDLVHLQDVINYLDDSFAENKDAEVKTSGETRFYDYFRELKSAMQNLCHEDNPNLLNLMQVIETYLLKKGGSSQGIIFVRTRAIAEALVSWLSRCNNEEIRGLKASVFTGTNVKESQGGMTQSQQNALVSKFKEGKVKILVATSVAEEGLDVPACNLVIKYNHVGNEITTIQTRGRSRKAGGNSILLGMPKICEKEAVNRKRTKLMYGGIEDVRKMDKKVFDESVLQIQKTEAEKREMEQMIADQKKEFLKDKKFRVICRLCRKFSIESEDIRIVCENHRIAINKDIWRHAKIIPKDPKYIHETQIVGSVRCMCQVEDGTMCNSPLGTVVYFNKVYFLAVGIKLIMFEEEDRKKPVTVKKWKDVPYPIDVLSFEDIKRYLKSGDKTNFGIQETEPAEETHLSSYASSMSHTSSESYRSASSMSHTSPESVISTSSTTNTSAIYRRYEAYLESGVSDYVLDSTAHMTQRKVVVESKLDSGYSFDSTSDSAK